jgi:hypothetical protein
MRTEFTRQTRWGHPPDRVDEAQRPPGTPYVKQLVWIPCPECDLQVHAAASRLPAEGLHCPECGGRLAAAEERPQVAIVRLIEREESFRRQLEREEN